MNTQGKLLVEALNAKYQSQQKSAMAGLSVYLNNTVAIGEHPQHEEEMDKYVEAYDLAASKLSSLKEMVEKISELDK
jgi:hypothetical protein